MPTDNNRTIPQLLQEIQQQYPDTDAQWWKDNKGQYHPTTYKELYADVISFAAGLKSLGIQRGDHVGLLSDNRREWMVADLAVLSLGAADVPRGRDAMPYEIRYILGFSGCRYCFAENEDQLKKVKKLLPELPDLEYLIVLDPQFEKSVDHISVTSEKSSRTVQLLTFAEILETGRQAHGNTKRAVENDIAKGDEQETATIIFTSGTTGEPKGVMLTHKNFMHQVNLNPYKT